MNRLIYLVAWDPKDAATLADLLSGAGWAVVVETRDGGRAVQQVALSVPAAVVIDLSRRPAHGRETAAAIRERERTRAIPILFLNGDPVDVERAKEAVPDGVFLTSGALLDWLSEHGVQ
jgi:CheY-like chemotaxis protein